VLLAHRPAVGTMRPRQPVREVAQTGCEQVEKVGIDEIVNAGSLARGPEVAEVAGRWPTSCDARPVGEVVTSRDPKSTNTNICTFKCRFLRVLEGPLYAKPGGGGHAVPARSARKIPAQGGRKAVECGAHGGVASRAGSTPNFDGEYYPVRWEACGERRAAPTNATCHGFTRGLEVSGRRRADSRMPPARLPRPGQGNAGLARFPGTAAEVPRRRGARAGDLPRQGRHEEVGSKAHRLAHCRSGCARKNVPPIMFRGHRSERPVACRAPTGLRRAT